MQAIMPRPMEHAKATAAVALQSRLYYLDYLRAAVVGLVMLHHTAITYGGGAGTGWYYLDRTGGAWTGALLTMFVSLNQAWFMGFLFLLSGYLSLPSLMRKGPGQYVLDRLRRFGIPLLVYLFAISPLVTWMASPAAHGPLLRYWASQYLTLRVFDAGPLWFVEALLVMDVLLAVVARWLPAARVARSFPRGWAVGAFIAGLGAATFLVRMAMPVGASFLSLQLAYFPSYVAMFVVGMFAWRRGWLDAIPAWAVRRAGWTVAACLAVLVLVQLPHGGSSAGALHAGTSAKSLLEAIWEQLVLVGMSILALRWGQRRLNRPSPRWQGWSAASYVAYIIQPLVLVPLAILFRSAAWPALVKFGVVGLLTVVVAYAVARGLRLIPPVRAALG